MNVCAYAPAFPIWQVRECHELMEDVGIYDATFGVPQMLLAFVKVSSHTHIVYDRCMRPAQMLLAFVKVNTDDDLYQYMQ